MLRFRKNFLFDVFELKYIGLVIVNVFIFEFVYVIILEFL